MSSTLSLESLAEMFPSYSLNVIRDVATQCDNNHEVTLEKLLELQEEEPACSGDSLPAPVALQTGQAMKSVFFPAERGATSAKAGQRRHTAGGDQNYNPLTGALRHLTTAAAPPAVATPPSGNHQGDVTDLEEYSDFIPGLITLDTGQAKGLAPTQLAPTAVVPTSRCWWPLWPLWPLTPAVASGHLPAGCSRVNHLAPAPACNFAPTYTASASDSWSAPVTLSDSSSYCTPPRAGRQEGHSSPLLPTPLGSAPFHTHHPSPPRSDDEALALLMPHLAHCLVSPSPSGTSSPACHPTAPPAHLPRPASQQQEGFGAAELVAAVEFYLHMFPNLKREVVGDVLERYCDAPQSGVDQLIMLSSCVENASGEGSSGSDTGVPDALGWESVSSGSDDEEAAQAGDAAGSSWEVGLTAEELAGMEHGLFPASLPLTAQGSAAELVPFSAGNDEMPLKEKEEVLRAEFKSIAAQEVAAALAACDGSLFAAADLLRTFAAEDVGRGLNGGAQSAAAAAASVPTAAVTPPEPLTRTDSTGSSLPQHVQPKVRHLARRFPGVLPEALEAALAACSYDLASARRTMREAGYTEAEVEPSPANTRTLPMVPDGLATTLPRPVPLPSRSATSGSAAGSPLPIAQLGLACSPPAVPQPSAPPAPPLSLSEATYLRNQTIFEQERAQAQRLEQAYRRCFELAAEAHARGDHAAATDLSMRGREYRQQFHEEQSKASRRISKRVNAANGLPHIRVDLHGQTVADALGTVESGIRNLPESIPGGVVVRYITGKGLHSTGGAARIKPEVVRLLSERGIPFVEAPNGGGWVEATLVPAH